MSRWPLRHRVIVDASSGTDGLDYATMPGLELLPSGLWSVPVYAWELAKSDRLVIDGWTAVVDLLRIYAPPGRFADGQKIGDTEQLGWTVEGSAIDHNHGPGWRPGLVIYEATRTISRPWK